MALGKIGNQLLAYYKFEGLAGSGVTYDSSENGRTLTNVNGVFVTTGKVGDGAGFTNANERYLFSADSAFNFDGSTDWTIVGWAEVDNLSPPGSDQVLWGKYDDDGGSNDRQYLCFFDASEDKFRAIVSQDGASNSADVSPSNTISANTFYMLTMEWDSAAQALSLQINNGTGGNIASGVAGSQVINQSAANFKIGDSTTTTGDAFLDGTVDEVMIWDRLLTDAEKTALYNGGAGINLLPILNPSPLSLPEASGFYPIGVQGQLRPTAQIIQWNPAAPDPSGRRHVESGSYRKTAHLQNVGGFTAQQESGVALDFGDIAIPGGGSGFQTDTVPITFNMGDLNSNPNSRFDQLFNEGSGTGSDDLTAFNFRMWIGNLDAFDVVAYSGAAKTPVQVKPVFWYRESAQWRQGYKLEFTDSSGVQISGVSIVPSSMPDCPNVFSREDEVMVSGAYLDREFSNFVYLRGNFPDLPSGQFYKLGTYGGLGQQTFTTKFSYDYTRKDSNILVPTDVKDFPLSVVKGFPLQTLNEGLSGWWQMNESSPKLSQVSGFQVDDGFTAAQVSMTLSEVVEGGGSVGRHTGIVSSGTASGWAMNLRSNRRDQVYTSSTDPVTMNFDGNDADGDTGFTFTGWFSPNDPSGTDPAATGVGARIPSLHTGILCRWNLRFSLSAFQYRLWYSRAVGRILGQFNMEDFRSPLLPYNYMSVDGQENGHWSADDPGGGGQIDGGGGGLGRHEWYFIAFGYDPNGEGSPGGDMFLRINDGPIERQPVSASIKGLDNTAGSTASPPFSIGNFFTRTAGNGSLGPGAGQYDNWTLHRRQLTNREMLDLYNNGFGQEYPVGRDRVIDFDLPPEQAIVDLDPDPVPLRRTLKAFYNFSEPSGVERVVDAQRYADLTPNNAQLTSGALSGTFMPTSGIVVDQMPAFDDLASASGALQIRKDGGVGFEDGQIGNNVWWEAATPSQMAAIGDTEITIAAWVRWPNSGATDPIASQWTAAGNNRYWVLNKNSSDNVTFGRANGTTIGQPSTIVSPPEFSAGFTPGRWYFVYVTNEMTGGLGSSESTWSLNVHDPIAGETYTTTQVSTFQWADVNNSVPVTIGAFETLGTAVVGDIDIAAFGFWRRKLSANEISSLINSGQGLNFGASNFDKISRVYWDSQKKRDGDPSTI